MIRKYSHMYLLQQKNNNKIINYMILSNNYLYNKSLQKKCKLYFHHVHIGNKKTIKKKQKIKKIKKKKKNQIKNRFDLDQINQIEKESLSEFFCGKPSKTQEIYKKYRNYIVQTYRENPRNYLSATACRKNLIGDVCSIIRIHGFLEYWGIINFNCDTQTLPKHLAEQIHFSKDLKQSQNICKLKQQYEVFIQIFFVIYIINHNIQKQLQKKNRPICDFCGVICGLIWHEEKQMIESQQENIILCNQCFYEGNYPNFLSDKDFKKKNLINKINEFEQQKNNDFQLNENEKNKIIQLIESNKDNWEKTIKELSESKNKNQIFIYFVKIPLQNVFMQAKIIKNEEKKIQQQVNGGNQIIENRNNENQQIQLNEKKQNKIIQHVNIYISFIKYIYINKIKNRLKYLKNQQKKYKRNKKQTQMNRKQKMKIIKKFKINKKLKLNNKMNKKLQILKKYWNINQYQQIINQIIQNNMKILYTEKEIKQKQQRIGIVLKQQIRLIENMSLIKNQKDIIMNK
ncbi:swirm domain protein [Ichthyophthirius multifiliis]|uniref:Swirm domain protein n=1 Tax=Ichthyophthirius multifiliis TaxID=5932 RepID=G0QSQ8_ICHMU|nr:swirm domain protein [Ichthyophthirius multifiliis]EGR31774.1 swirm domain protein [Ichthyophthirius multifiliis]|eukprot:XP_004035260.1 swirm domain protein [Ichthyophthirius multifiliis]